MKQHLNTLFITTQGAYLRKDGQTVDVRVEKKSRLRLPLHNLGGIVCFGRVACSPALMGTCAESGVAISYLTINGRFLARVSGFTAGNVLLRRTQYRRADEPVQAATIARAMVAGKLANCRAVLLRAGRDYPNADGRARLEAAATRVGQNLGDVQQADSVERVRGLEGDSASAYFQVFNDLITAQGEEFVFRGRSRRPPLDNVNALLSFLYAMVLHDARAACEVAGLDPAVGYLHADRPGRPGLALDLMEEFRPFLADRLALSLINRKQVQATGFTTQETGAVLMNDATRRAVLGAYQKRKQDTLMHPFLAEKTTIGLLLHLQAQLLARHLRGDLDGYPPFLWK
jgi:CRISPR-associated protein Cas1